MSPGWPALRRAMTAGMCWTSCWHFLLNRVSALTICVISTSVCPRPSAIFHGRLFRGQSSESYRNHERPRSASSRLKLRSEVISAVFVQRIPTRWDKENTAPRSTLGLCAECKNREATAMGTLNVSGKRVKNENAFSHPTTTTVMGGLDPPIHPASVCERRVSDAQRASDGWPGRARP